MFLPPLLCTLLAAKPESSFLSLGFIYKGEMNSHVTRRITTFINIILSYLSTPAEFTAEEWLFLRALKLRIDELKKELYGEEIIKAEDEERVTKERKRHINKRFNIRDDWLPLH